MNWWAPRESNTAPTDYESAALTKHELGAQYEAVNLALTFNIQLIIVMGFWLYFLILFQVFY